MQRYWELSYPYVFAILIIIPLYFLEWDLADVRNLPSILNSGVTISSIVIAFLATAISILITVSNAEVMKRINNNDVDGDLKSYIEITIVSGFILAIYSTTLNIFVDLTGLVSRILLIVFVVLVVFFVLSAYRIIHIFLKILNEILKENKSVAKEKKTFKPQIKDK